MIGISNPLVHRENRRVAIIITTEDFKVVDLDLDEEEARELYEKLGKGLEQLSN